ncbi:tRNA (guanine-N7-)-methyltransferase [Thermoflavifilum aggregans]|uniref:tRNA (guanine-N(7)-)-methyltransferase n=1 Tax=Thermoflavifilum aggregans TaxID=454188 RepID=A0A2M9CS03_9BACT|nr:tRNA (guanosine(46)-N7)-methyltransferase TrmB [Thermoflavifilum aggregans]PJJ74615.1 tRNA (guanine-N7-)-methyltransferase [Thermoflavifilum aggregans]
MAHKKLIRFEEIKLFPNVLSFPEGMAGKWHAFFKNDFPIVLELGCGKGEYSLGLVRMYKKLNAIGVDVKGNRIWKGARTALDEQLNRVAFLRIQIEQLVMYFARGEVSAIWIPFPDPHPRKSRAKKRLTHPRFLWQYQQILQPGGLIHLKTDSRDLFDFTLEVIAQTGCKIFAMNEDVPENAEAELGIETYYERQHRAEGRKIHYLSFTLPDNPDTFEPWSKATLSAIAAQQQGLFHINHPSLTNPMKHEQAD